jgi:hypothetical protein
LFERHEGNKEKLCSCEFACGLKKMGKKEGLHAAAAHEANRPLGILSVKQAGATSPNPHPNVSTTAP